MKIKRFIIRLRRGPLVIGLLKACFLLASLLPVRKQLVIFESFHGKQYSDNPRAIYEYMRTHYPELELYWSADRRHTELFAQQQLPYLRRFSFAWICKMARARYWIVNARMPQWLPKRKGTMYVQTWHGTPLKRLAADMDAVYMPGTDTERYKRNFLEEAAKWDMLLSPNAYSTEIFRRAFDFKKEVLEFGYPRNDVLTNQNNMETVEQLKKACQLPTDKKVILYAPTWRDNQFYDVGKYKFEIQLDMKRMQKELGEDYVLVLRLHYLVAENLDLTGLEGFAYDFSTYGDIKDLYLLADILITDYSSVFFDYAILKRPILFFVYDLDDYRDDLRGFYFDFEQEAPGPLLQSTMEIIDTVQQLEQSGFAPTAERQAFYERFCSLEDGNASKHVVERILQES
ncbi:CDP-glycerol glycerophosphotransferase family protein [Ornithinibacillus gellani]|uniref:CDP-glycerol glycerophosphotransferase family protein n=1 Tax=Ornithinibacillus gellani TaxID=2293253 RepID=UPI001CC1DD9E|nr:CDP-glycerol glycerophosphotransferase family protein [Ornithinibacillus gellani]